MEPKAPSKDDFVKAFELCASNAIAKGQAMLNSQFVTPKGTKEEYERKIIKDAPKYKESIKAIKELDEIKKILPPKKYSLLEMAARDAKDTVNKVEGYRNVLTLAKTQVKEAEANMFDAEKTAKELDKELILVSKMVKSGFIEEMRFQDNEISWIYPPMVYTDTSTNRSLFLGRPRISISNKSPFGLQVKFPSYKFDDVGTIHAENGPNGDSFCLGGYENIVFVLCAKKQLSHLVRLMKEYLYSCNTKSRYTTPNAARMRIDKPEVCDDSYEVWKKSDPHLAARLAEAFTPLPEPVDDEEEEEEDA